MEKITFPEAFADLISGAASAIRRKSWEPGMTVHIQNPSSTSAFTEPFLVLRVWSGQGKATKLVPYEPGNASLFATDWETEHNFSN